MSGGAHARASDVERAGARASDAPTAATSGRALASVLGVVVAVVLGIGFVAIALPVLGTLPHDFDEGWFMLDARLIQRGERPFADFPHHEMPLQLYLLALAGQVFGPTLVGYRMLSVLSVALSGLALFWLARPFVGVVAALLAEAVFLFSPVHSRSLTGVPETPGMAVMLVATALLFTRSERWSTWASGIACVIALLIKPTYLVVVVAAALGLAWARQWRRLADFTTAGVVAAILGIAWVVWLSDGVFADVVRFQMTKIGTHQGGMWTIDSGFTDMKRLLGIETPRQWAAINFQTFFQSRVERTPIALFGAALLAIPVWIFGCARADPALRAFVVLWPASLLALNFFLMDFVSPRYFVPFFAFVGFLVAGWAWLAERWLGTRVLAVVATLATVVLAGHVATTLGSDGDPWFWGRTDAIAHEHPTVVSFNPIYFAATGTEPGCGFGNSALTYGSFGENILQTERTRRFRFGDDRLIACLRANPDLPVVIDWAFYFFTRPGSRLREYLAGEGSGQRLFFSPEAVQQWDRPLLRMSPLR